MKRLRSGQRCCKPFVHNANNSQAHPQCLSQARYIWRHNQVLKSGYFDDHNTTAVVSISFCPWSGTITEDADTDQEWTDGNAGGNRPPTHNSISSPPWHRIWSNTWVVVCFVELTVPWRRPHRRELWDADAAVHRPERRCGTTRATVRPVEVECHGFIATSILKLL